MSSKPATRVSFRRAYLLSIALHVTFFSLLVVAPEPYLGALVNSNHPGLNETTQVAYLTIEHRAPLPHTVRQVALTARTTTPEPVKRSRPKPVRRPTAQPLPRPQDDPNAVVANTRPQQAGRLVIALITAPPERSESAAAVKTEDVPAPTDAPSAAPQPEHAAVSATAPAQSTAQSAASGIDMPPGGWGQSFEKPIVADDEALSSLRARYHAGAPIEVVVDESGRATRVMLPSGLADDVRAELERKLLAMRYVPAECNGLRCTGTLQLTL